MKFYEALGAVIREERLSRGLTLREVSARGHVSMGHLSDVENARKEGSENFIDAVAGALRLPSYELIIEAGYRMADSTVPDTVEDLLIVQDFISSPLSSPVG
jgi:transcriptional regulator with XRE-family HTH domain